MTGRLGGKEEKYGDEEEADDEDGCIRTHARTRDLCSAAAVTWAFLKRPSGSTYLLGYPRGPA